MEVDANGDAVLNGAEQAEFMAVMQHACLYPRGMLVNEQDGILHDDEGMPVEGVKLLSFMLIGERDNWPFNNFIGAFIIDIDLAEDIATKVLEKVQKFREGK